MSDIIWAAIISSTVLAAAQLLSAHIGRKPITDPATKKPAKVTARVIIVLVSRPAILLYLIFGIATNLYFLIQELRSQEPLTRISILQITLSIGAVFFHLLIFMIYDLFMGTLRIIGMIQSQQGKIITSQKEFTRAVTNRLLNTTQEEEKPKKPRRQPKPKNSIEG